MPEQLTFDLPARPALGRDDFFVSPSNAMAVATVGDWQNWPGGKLVLTGPKGSGKTHLAHVWASDAAALVIDAVDLQGIAVNDLVQQNRNIAVEDVDRIAGQTEIEDALFHLHNLALAEGGHLLVTGCLPPHQWELALPDLASRMQGTNAVALAAPDDALLAAVFVKLFSDRQLAVPPKTIAYLVTRMERSFEGAQNIVAALDAAALAQRRAITQPFATSVLDQLSLDSE